MSSVSVTHGFKRASYNAFLLSPCTSSSLPISLTFVSAPLALLDDFYPMYNQLEASSSMGNTQRKLGPPKQRLAIKNISSGKLRGSNYDLILFANMPNRSNHRYKSEICLLLQNLRKPA